MRFNLLIAAAVLATGESASEVTIKQDGGMEISDDAECVVDFIAAFNPMLSLTQADEDHSSVLSAMYPECIGTEDLESGSTTFTGDVRVSKGRTVSDPIYITCKASAKTDLTALVEVYPKRFSAWEKAYKSRGTTNDGFHKAICGAVQARGDDMLKKLVQAREDDMLKNLASLRKQNGLDPDTPSKIERLLR